MEKQLPKGWGETVLGNIAKKLVDGSHNPPTKKNAGLPMLSAINISSNKISYEPCRLITEDEFELEHRRTNVEAGDILLTIVGAIGRVAVVPEHTIPFTLQRSVAVITPIQMDSKFLMHQLESSEASKYFKENARGTAQKGVYLKTLAQLPVKLPSLNEQNRIVAKIEELFSELDKGIESLQTAREQLKVYRQAVLKHAFEGKLTEQWRKDNADKLESPEQLLARIQQERDTRYQQQLEDWKTAVKEWEANGKEGKKPGKPKELLTLGEVGSGSQLVFDIPDEWKFELIGNIFSVHVGATPSRKNNQFWNGDISWVSSGEVAFGDIHATNETITHAGYENTSTEIHPEGTVLLAMIGEGKTRGQAAILRISAAHNQNTAAVRVSEVGLPPEYIYYFLLYQYEQTRRVGSGNNQKALNKNRVASIQFPLCSAEEQIAIVQALSEKLSSIESVNQELEIQLTKAETLRQSILKKAFSGQLVPQDPNDEPASELLTRIQAEKAALSAKAKKTPAKRSRKVKEVSED